MMSGRLGTSLDDDDAGNMVPVTRFFFD